LFITAAAKAAKLPVNFYHEPELSPLGIENSNSLLWRNHTIHPMDCNSNSDDSCSDGLETHDGEEPKVDVVDYLSMWGGSGQSEDTLEVIRSLWKDKEEQNRRSVWNWLYSDGPQRVRNAS